MSFDEKVDVIDLIINVLREHEKNLDDLVSRLEKALEQKTPPRAEAGLELRKPLITAVVNRWAEFRERCLGSGIVAFDIEDKQFRVSALNDGVLYAYGENMPDMEIRMREKDDRTVIDGIDIGSIGQVPAVLRGRLECGLEVSVKGAEVRLPDGVVVYKVLYDVDADEARNWLSHQLKVDKKAIIQGELRP